MVFGEYCEIYLGDMKNKKELEKVRKSVREYSIRDGLGKLDKSYRHMSIKQECISQIINQYLEKVVVVSHTEKGKKICEKVKIRLDPEVIKKYFESKSCLLPPLSDDDIYEVTSEIWVQDVNRVMTKKNDKINIGLIIETKNPDIEVSKREQLENEQEKQFFNMTEKNKDKYKVIDRRHLIKILEEQKLSSSGITERDTLKLGKISNLDIIVLRIIYEGSKVTKVLKVDTGEVLLFWTYGEKKDEGWIYYGKTDDGDWYYDNESMTYVSPKVIKVWDKIKYSKSRKEDEIKSRRENKESIDGYDKLDFKIALTEVDCINNTQKTIKTVDYDVQGKILDEYNYPDMEMEQTLPGSIGDLLRIAVCPK